MRRPKIKSMGLLATLVGSVLCLANANAGKPDKSGGGNGGGGGSPSYKIVKLNTNDAAGQALTGTAYDINLSRLIVGSVNASAAYWSVTELNGEFQSQLHFLDHSLFAFTGAYGCNESGEIVGDAGTGDYPTAAVYWADMEASLEELPAPLAFRSAEAINNDSVICGWSASGFYAENERRALVWSLSSGQWTYLELTPLGTPPKDEKGNTLPDQSYAVAICDEDYDTGLITIAGSSNGNAVIWTVSRTDSGGLVAGPAMILDANSEATGLNNTVTVCGFGDLGPSWGGDGVVWVEGGTAQVLALDDSRTWNSPHSSFTRDINDNGIIVGENAHAVMWSNKDAQLIVLDDFLPKGKNSPFFSLTEANAISEANEIVGSGSPDDSGSLGFPFLAVPQ